MVPRRHEHPTGYHRSPCRHGDAFGRRENVLIPRVGRPTLAPQTQLLAEQTPWQGHDRLLERDELVSDVRALRDATVFLVPFSGIFAKSPGTRFKSLPG